MLRTSKEEIVELEAEKKKIDKEYTKTVNERNRILDDYNKKLAGLGDRYKEISKRIRELKPPIEVKE